MQGKTNNLTVPRSQSLTAELLQDQIIDLDREFAAKYLSFKEFDGERQINMRHVDYLLTQMRDGRFNWSNVNVATAEFLGETYKINSQHTQQAALALEGDWKVQVRHLHYRCRTLQELKTLYSTFDRNRPRTNSHLSHVELAGTPIAQVVSKRMLNLLGGGYCTYLNTEMEANQRAATIQQFHDLSARIGAWDANRSVQAFRFVKRQAIVAAILATFARNTDPVSDAAADEFWSNVAEGTMLQPGSAQYSLNRYLETHFLNVQATGKKKTAPHLVVSTEDMFRVCLRAWNHHCTDRPIQPQAFRPGNSRPNVLRYSDVKGGSVPTEQELVAS